MLWDRARIGNQAQYNSLLELQEVRKSSFAVIYASAAVSAAIALYWY